MGLNGIDRSSLPSFY